jgi:hypothetical protein
MATSGLLPVLTDGNRLSMIRKLGVHTVTQPDASTPVGPITICS